MDENLSFGYWVRRRRKALDLTQAELGRRVSVSEAMIRKIEADERRPSRELAELLADQLAVPAAERVAFLRAARDILAVEKLEVPREPVLAPGAAQQSPSNLPAPMTSMVNRARDLDTITKLLLRDDVRLLTLLGPPGMGKTRLSIQVAQQASPHFADGVWFVDLSTTIDPAGMLPAITLVLGLPPAPGMPVDRQVQSALRDKRLLLVLDNLEQIVDGAAPAIASLLRSCAGLKVLATSRVHLDIYGEHEYPLPPMSLPPAAPAYEPGHILEFEAVQLFVARARQHQPDFDVTSETAGPVVEICRRMDGLPLALELAAARTRRMTVEDLAVALREASGRDWHALLHTTTRDLLPRQQTLFTAIAWSYSLLEPSLKTVLAQMGVFVGPFDWPAVVATILVPGLPNKQALRNALERLVDHNLVSWESHALGSWRLLEMVREFARSQMDESELRAANKRHARYFADALTHLLRHVSGKEYLAQVERIADNSKAALQWALESGEPALAFQLGAAFEWYWEQRGLLDEGRRFLEQVLDLPGEVPDGLRFDVLHGAANQAWMQHDLDVAHRHADAGLVLARERGEYARIAGFLNLRARIFLEEGQYEQADQALGEGLSLGQMHLRDLNPRFMIIQRGEAALGMGHLDRAEALLREGLEGVAPEDVIPFCVGWTNLAQVGLEKGDAVLARQALIQVGPRADLHSRRMRVYLATVTGLAILDAKADRLPTAVAMLAYVTKANTQLGDPLSPKTQQLMAERITAMQHLLSPDHWQVAWDEGQRWTAAQALAAAMGLLETPL